MDFKVVGIGGAFFLVAVGYQVGFVVLISNLLLLFVASFAILVVSWRVKKMKGTVAFFHPYW